MAERRVCVAGAGVVGMTTALVLQNRGWSVRVAQHPRYRQTSLVAAAFWYPYAVNFLRPGDEQRLAEPALDRLTDAAADPASGVRLVPGVEYFDHSVVPGQRQEPWWARLPGVGFHELPRHALPEVPKPVGRIEHGWGFEVPVVHTPTYLAWLRRGFEAGGGAVEQRDVSSLADPDLRGEFDAVVNCTGGWASRLCREEDHLTGVRGVVVHVPRHLYSTDRLVFVERGRSERMPVYIVPHLTSPDHPTVLGGTLEEVIPACGVWEPDDAGRWTPPPEQVRSVIERCALVDPRLAALVPLADGLPALAGLRPRRENRPPRIQLDDSLSDGTFRVVHNYGHGGAGVTLSWGSAGEVGDLLANHLGG